LKALAPLVAVALKSKSFPEFWFFDWKVFLRKPLLVMESPPILLGLATEPLGALDLKNSLEAALELLTARW
jgi:hypothetical protein